MAATLRTGNFPPAMEAAAPSAAPSATPQIFRARRSYVLMGLVGAVLYAVGTVAVLSWPITSGDGPESKPQDVSQVYIAGAIFAAFALLNAYLAWVGIRYRLVLSPDAVRIVELFTDRCVTRRVDRGSRAAPQCVIAYTTMLNASG